MSVTVNDILAKLEGVRAASGGYIARCPAHDDVHQSLSISNGEKGIVVRCFAGCTFENITSALGLTASDFFYENGGGGGRIAPARCASVQGSGCTLSAYAEYKKLPIEFLRDVGVQEIAYYNGSPAVRICYFDETG